MYVTAPAVCFGFLYVRMPTHKYSMMQTGFCGCRLRV